MFLLSYITGRNWTQNLIWTNEEEVLLFCIFFSWINLHERIYDCQSEFPIMTLDSVAMSWLRIDNNPWMPGIRCWRNQTGGDGIQKSRQQSHLIKNSLSRFFSKKDFPQMITCKWNWITGCDLGTFWCVTRVELTETHSWRFGDLNRSKN